MQGVGEAALIVQPGASPHGHATRPFEAAPLQSADVVVWVGEALALWLERAIATLGAEAGTLERLEVPGAVTLTFREGATFEAHALDHDEAAEPHDHGADHDHDHAAASDHAHDHDHEGVEAHDHEYDPDHQEVAAAADDDHVHADITAPDHDHRRDSLVGRLGA